jgi:hypothetical protein
MKLWALGVVIIVSVAFGVYWYWGEEEKKREREARQRRRNWLAQKLADLSQVQGDPDIMSGCHLEQGRG